MSPSLPQRDESEARLDRILADFVARSWEREVALLPGATTAPFVSETDIFSALVAAPTLNETDQAASDYVVWIGGRIQPQPSDYFALISDGSLQGYLARMSAMAGGEEFTVLLPNPHRLYCPLRKRITSFARMLAAHSGIPCGGFDSGIFLGRYGRTPFGVHRGQMSVLTFPVLGTKRFLLWPRSYGEIHRDIQDSLNYDQHSQSATVLTIGPGDIGYWPADYWHIAEGAVAYSTALNIGLWWDRPPLDMVLRSFGEVLTRYHHEIDADHVCIDAPLDASTGIAPSYERALDLVANIARSTETRAELEFRYLAMRSAYGMRDPYTTRTIEKRSRARPLRAKLANGERIFVETLADGRLGVALLGRAIKVPPSPAIIADIGRLNCGGLLELDLSTIDEEKAETDVNAAARLTRLITESVAIELNAQDEDGRSK
jgi:hypothetical protein